MITFRWMTESRRQDPEGGDTYDYRFGELMVEGHPTESYSFTATPTTHPIERSANITDHVIDGLNTLDLECVVPRVTLDPRIDFDPDRPNTVMQTLRRLKSGGVPVDVETDRGIFESYLITEITEERTADNGDAARFNVQLQELIVADLETVDAPSPRVERARPQRNRGNQNASNSGATADASDDPADRESVRQSLAARGLDFLRSTD